MVTKSKSFTLLGYRVTLDLVRGGVNVAQFLLRFAPLPYLKQVLDGDKKLICNLSKSDYTAYTEDLLQQMMQTRMTKKGEFVLGTGDERLDVIYKLLQLHLLLVSNERERSSAKDKLFGKNKWVSHLEATKKFAQMIIKIHKSDKSLEKRIIKTFKLYGFEFEK